MSDAAGGVRVEDLLAHYAWVQRLAMRIVRDRSLADDVAQQTFLTALQSPPRDGTRVRSWLARVATNVARQEWRRGSARMRREAAVARRTFSEDSATSVARAEAQKVVLERVLELEDPFRTTILLRFREGLQPREIATRHGVPVETVRSRIRRALAEIRGRLRDERGDAWRVALVPLLPFAAPPATSGAPSARATPPTRTRRALRSAVAAGLLVAATVSTWAILARPRGDADGPGVGAAPGAHAVAEATSRPRERAAIPQAPAGTSPTRDAAAPEPAPRAPVAVVPWSRAATLADPEAAQRDVVFRFRPFPPPKELPAGDDVEVRARVPGTVEARLPLVRADGTPVASFTVSVDDPDLLPWSTRIDAPPAGAAGDAAPLGPLVRAVVVHGSVEGAEGLADLLAAAAPLAGTTSWPVDQVAVGADGAFRLRTRPGEAHVVVVAARDHRPSLTDVAAGTSTGTELPRVTLATGGVLRGTVRDVLGAPVADAGVLVQCEYLGATLSTSKHALTFGAGRAAFYSVRTTTDGLGGYSVGGLGDGALMIRVTPLGASAAILERLARRVVPADGPHDFVVEAATHRLTAVRGGVPAPGVLVTTVKPRPAGYLETGADGTATLLVAPGEETVVELGRKPDTHAVRLRALAAGESASETVELPALPARASWRVRVKGLADPAAEFCGVSLRPLDDAGKAAFTPARDVRLAAGVFVVGELAPGRYRAVVRPGTLWADARNLNAEFHCDVELAPGAETETTIEVVPAGRIDVRALDEEGRRVVAVLKLKNAAGARVPLTLLGAVGIPGAEMRDMALAEGPTLLHPALPPGTYTLELDGGSRRAGPLTVEIRAGEVTKVEGTLRR